MSGASCSASKTSSIAVPMTPKTWVAPSALRASMTAAPPDIVAMQMPPPVARLARSSYPAGYCIPSRTMPQHAGERKGTVQPDTELIKADGTDGALSTEEQALVDRWQRAAGDRVDTRSIADVIGVTLSGAI